MATQKENPTVRIDLCCDGAEALRAYVVHRMQNAMGRFRTHIRWARIKVADAGEGATEGDKRCVVQLRLRNLPDVMFAITRFDVRSAVDAAAMRAARILACRLRNGRIHPGVNNLALA
jgi:hypothetical protein